MSSIESWFLRQHWIDAIPEIFLGIISGPMGCSSPRTEEIERCKNSNLFKNESACSKVSVFFSDEYTITRRPENALILPGTRRHLYPKNLMLHGDTVSIPLLRSETIQGLECAQDTTIGLFLENGLIEHATLATTQTLQGTTCLQGALATFKNDGTLISCR